MAIKGALAVVAFLVCMTQPGNEPTWKERFAVATEPWQDNKACGPNCLFVFLRAFGAEVDHNELVRALPRSERGVSLATLQEAAARYGVPAQTVCAAPDALTSLPLPAILHLGEGDEDHFVVLCELNEGNAIVVDGGTGRVRKMELAGLVQRWSRYALVHGEPRWVSMSRLGIYFAAAAVAF